MLAFLTGHTPCLTARVFREGAWYQRLLCGVCVILGGVGRKLVSSSRDFSPFGDKTLCKVDVRKQRWLFVVAAVCRISNATGYGVPALGTGRLPYG